MASTINAKSTGVGGIDASGDASGVLALQTGGTTAVTIDASQNVGIGTASPASKTDIAVAAATSTVTTALSLTTTTDTASNGSKLAFRQSGQTYDSAQIGFVRNGANANGSLTFSTQGTAWSTTDVTERMRIDSSGNVLIGTTGATCLLSAGPVSSKGGLFGSANTAGSPGIQGAHTVNSGTGYVAYFANSGSGTGLYISNTAAWQSTSDIRLKTDIKDLDTTSRLLQLRPVDYLWKTQETSDNPTKRNLGFIAQEVKEVFPELVGESPDGMLSVEYTGLIAPLVKAIQELKAIIDTQQTRITALEAK